MRNYIYAIVSGAMLFSCQENEGGNNNETAADNALTADSVAITSSKTVVANPSGLIDASYTSAALDFINAYVENSNRMNEAQAVAEWVVENPLATDALKRGVKKVVDEAYRVDPDMGLSSDPIFDAQDNPEEGFEVESADEKTGYVVVRGKEWKDFKLTMKVVNENGKWLVDGSGVVNIPVDKRMKR